MSPEMTDSDFIPPRARAGIKRGFPAGRFFDKLKRVILWG